MSNEILFTPDDIVYAYTRAQAVEDGEQVLLEGEYAKLAKEIGYKYPVYFTSTVWNLVEMSVSNKRNCNDLTGVIWDILWMSRKASRRIDDQTSKFKVIITGTGRQKYHDLLIQCGPTDIDDPRPCLTIMHPDEN